MKQINVLYWNVENFGSQTVFKSQYQPLCQLMAWTAQATQADVILIQEAKRAVLANPSALIQLHAALNNLPEPRNNWYCDLIKGSIRLGGVAPPVPPYASSADLGWDAAHDEGYVMFWNQNIAKFLVSRAPPVEGAENTQSETVRLAPGPPVPFPANAGLEAPAGGYTIPEGTEYVPGEPIVVNENRPAGFVLPEGTKIGDGGVRLAAPPPGFNPVLIPGRYTLREPVTLPVAGTVLIPSHALALVLQGRDTGAGGEPSTVTGRAPAANFVPGAGAAQMREIWFTRGAGFPASRRGPRRPAYATLNLNPSAAVATAAQRLVPLIVYHAPSALPASASGMQRAAYSQPLYQAYDWATATWIDNDRAVLGGDFNVRTGGVQYAYNAFTQAFAAGGANCQIRAFAPPPPQATAPANQSMVQLNLSPQPRVRRTPIVSPALGAYRRLAIDNVFYRGFLPAQAPPPPPASTVVDMLSAVSGVAGIPQVPAATIRAFVGVQQLGVCLLILMGLAQPPAPPLPEIQSWEDLVRNIWAGNFAAAPVGLTPPARTAAEFINKCVSDHLPVVFQMEL